jgi:hypothetical protein
VFRDGMAKPFFCDAISRTMIITLPLAIFSDDLNLGKIKYFQLLNFFKSHGMPERQTITRNI